MQAVAQDGLALKYVYHQTDTICMQAVAQDGFALKYVHNQTETIYLKALNSCLNANRYNGYHYDSFGELYYTIKYPSPQLITILLKLESTLDWIILHNYAENIMKTYKACSDVIVTHLVPHANDLLYRPNSVNILAVIYARQYTTTNNAKTVFLMA
jgi:hypothetical protein